MRNNFMSWLLAAGLALGLGAGPGSLAVAQDKKPILIGGSLGMTGQFARMGEEEKRGISMWADEVNARGGLLGRQIEIKIYDDQSDPSTSAKLYERLIVQDKVDLLFSAFASPVVFAGSSVTEKHKFPMVAQGRIRADDLAAGVSLHLPDFPAARGPARGPSRGRQESQRQEDRRGDGGHHLHKGAGGNLREDGEGARFRRGVLRRVRQEARRPVPLDPENENE